MPGVGVLGWWMVGKMNIRLGFATDFLWAKVDAKMIDSLGMLRALRWVPGVGEARVARVWGMVHLP